MCERRLRFVNMLWLLSALSIPSIANPIDLSLLCGPGDCVVSADTTHSSASGLLVVTGEFTVNSGVVLEFLVKTQINIDGNLHLGGIVGSPRNEGVGGLRGEGATGQLGGNDCAGG